MTCNSKVGPCLQTGLIEQGVGMQYLNSHSLKTRPEDVFLFDHEEDPLI